MSKGSAKCPTQISREHEELQWALASGRITFKQYRRRYRELKRQGLVKGR